MPRELSYGDRSTFNLVNEDHFQDTFQHQPINAAEQIRLIRILSCSSKTIKCKLEVHDRHYHRYKAISYTWGSDTLRSEIICNGSRFRVGENCHYALYQAYHQLEQERLGKGETGDDDSDQGEEYLLWIDSVCIDQQNHAEKSMQVAMMGDIFVNASAVYACVGVSTFEGNFAALTLKDLGSAYVAPSERYDSIWRAAVCEWAVAKAWNNVTQRPAQMAEKCHTFQRGFVSLATQPFWRRMWIIQELWLGRNFNVLFGLTAISLQDLTYGIKLARQLETLDLPNKRSAMEELIAVLDGTELPICDAILSFEDWQCADYRDRVYALLNVTTWRSAALVPNYSLGDLAFLLQLATHAVQHNAYQMRIVPAIITLGSLARPSIHSSGDIHEFREKISCSQHRKELSPTREDSHTSRPLLLRDDHNVYLNHQLILLEEDDLADSPDSYTRAAIRETKGRNNAIETCHGVIGSVCRQAQPGDVLIDFVHASDLWLVARAANVENKYDLVGFAVLRHNSSTLDKSDPSISRTLLGNTILGSKICHMDLYLHPEDLVLAILLNMAASDTETTIEDMQLGHVHQEGCDRSYAVYPVFKTDFDPEHPQEDRAPSLLDYLWK